MKKILFYLTPVLLLIGCSKYFDKDPIGILTDKEVQLDPTVGTISTGVLNAYKPLSYTLNLLGDWDWDNGLVIRPDFILEDMAGGDANKKWNPDGDQAWMDDVVTFSFLAENGAFNGIWVYNYEGIARSNLAITQLADFTLMKEIGMDEGQRKQLLGEASYLRAFFYFDLVKYFGDVPMVLKPLINFNEAYEVAFRSRKEEVYIQMVTDLNVAIENLPLRKYSNEQERWRVSKGAAIALLAKVALFQEKWTEVVKQVDEIDKLGFYSLNTNYFDSFDETKAYTENENIFIYDHESGKQPNKGNGLTALLDWGFLAPTNEFISSFEGNDPRKDATVNVADKAIYKLMGAKNTSYKGNDDSPVNRVFIRYADVLLWKAEALIKQDQIKEGVTIINQIRKRARAGQTSVLPDHDVNTTDRAKAMSWLQKERRVELGMESHRLSDLRRWKIAKNTLSDLGRQYQDKHDLYPIPQGEVDKTNNKITQNEGYY